MLTKPVLLYSPSFDASKDKIFSFNVIGATSQIVANKLTIRKQNNNTVVYEQKQDSFKYEHILPKNTLTNGEYYNASITVFDNTGAESPASSPIQFWCYTTPTLVFTNIPETGIVGNASFNFELSYDQAEGERISSYSVNLYTASQILASSSGEIYVKEGQPPYSASYLFAGFEDNASYYVEAVAKTINGAVVSTGKVKFDVDYKRPDLFTLMVLENNCAEGTIKIGSNIVLIDGDTGPKPPKFIDDKEIDLTGEDAYVKWKQGYSISDDFLARGWFRAPNKYKVIAQFSNTRGQTIAIKYMEGYKSAEATSMQAYLQVTISSIAGIEHFIISNYIDILDSASYYVFQLERVNGVYQVALNKKI